MPPSLRTQISEIFRRRSEFLIPFKAGSISKIFFCGMGGSAISGDILRVLLAEACPLPFVVSRSPELPSWVDRSTLSIFSSYSGNTREVLECFQEALKRKSKVLVISSGGALAGLAEGHSLCLFKVPSGLAPRFALGYLSLPLLLAFRKKGWLDFSDGEIALLLKEMPKISFSQVRSLARKIRGRFVHLYATSGWMEPVALRWRTQLAENAKMPASHFFLPEMFHNEIEAWKLPKWLVKKSIALFFKDKREPVWIGRKRQWAQKIIRRQGGEVLEISSKGCGPLVEIFRLIHLGDEVSQALARLENVDPLEIRQIEALKKIE